MVEALMDMAIIPKSRPLPLWSMPQWVGMPWDRGRRWLWHPHHQQQQEVLPLPPHLGNNQGAGHLVPQL